MSVEIKIYNTKSLKEVYNNEKNDLYRSFIKNALLCLQNDIKSKRKQKIRRLYD